MAKKSFYENAIYLAIVAFVLIVIPGCGSGNDLLAEAGNLCQLTEKQVHEEPPTQEDKESVTSLQSNAPVLTLFKVSYKKNSRWNEISLLPEFLQSHTNPNTIVCISEGRQGSASYESGAKGYRIDWTVQIIGYPDGKVFAIKNFLSDDEPPNFKVGASDYYGDPPDEQQVSDWILSMLKGKSAIRIDNPIIDIALTPDGESLAIADGKNLQIWDVATETLSHRFDEVVSEKIAFSPDGKLLAGASNIIDDKDRVRLFDADSFIELPGFDEEESSILTLDFSPDSRLLATGNRDGVVKIWDVSARQVLHTFPGNKDINSKSWIDSYTVVFLPNGTTLMGGGDDGCLKGWDILTGETVDLNSRYNIGRLCETYGILDIAVSSDGTFLAQAFEKGDIMIYNIRKLGIAPEEVEGDSARGKNSIAFLPGGFTLVGNSKSYVQFWDAETARKLGKIENKYYVEKIVAFPDGKTVALLSGGMVRFVSVEDLLSK